jgi:hypothetical protein
MLGRALFVFVWLIIAAGLALPMYPPAVETASSPSTASTLQAAGSATSGCQECPPADEAPANCRSDCPCDHLLRAAFASFEGSFSLSVLVIYRPLALPPKLPAI